MRDTSLKAYAGILEELSAKRGKVYAAVFAAEEPSLCDYQIAQRLGWPINCVTGRRWELERMGYLVDDGVRPGPPEQHEVHYWRINEAALVPGWMARQLPKPKRGQRSRKRKPETPPAVSQAARIMAAHRRACKVKKQSTREYPLFK